MRIIAGEHRGRRLAAPKGDGTRPTTDRVRESLFSALASARGGLEGAVVLDAFAGSGALSLEALSRGAAFACLCERASDALKVIAQNIDALGLSAERARVVRGDVMRATVAAPPRSVSAQGYDLVFLDPPYAMAASETFGLVVSLDERGLLRSDAMVVYEHDSAGDDEVDAVFEALLAPRGFERSTRRAFGSTTIDILRR